MPRIARVVVPGAPHHVTQRGTGRQLVFYTRTDRLVYLRLLKENAERAGVRVLAYCLMPNHVHLVLTPNKQDSLAVALRRAHGRYAQYFNARKSRSGHLWQNRFYSCPLDQAHLWTALRYVEQNPVRAALVGEAVDYEWSSAQAHASGEDVRHLLDMDFWAMTGGTRLWPELLSSAQHEDELELLRAATYAGKPLGPEEFQGLAESIRQRVKDVAPGTAASFNDHRAAGAGAANTFD